MQSPAGLSFSRLYLSTHVPSLKFQSLATMYQRQADTWQRMKNTSITRSIRSVLKELFIILFTLVLILECYFSNRVTCTNFSIFSILCNLVSLATLASYYTSAACCSIKESGNAANKSSTNQNLRQLQAICLLFSISTSWLL